MVLRGLILGLLLAGCGASRAPLPEVSTTQDGVMVAVGVESSGERVALPPELTQVLAERVAIRGVQVQVLAVESGLEALGDRPTATGQLSHLATTAASGGWAVLVDLQASAFSNMQGRFRWVVSGHVGATSGHPDHSLVETVDIPVFLRFAHEGEEEALVAAIPMLERQLDALLLQIAAPPAED